MYVCPDNSFLSEVTFDLDIFGLLGYARRSGLQVEVQGHKSAIDVGHNLTGDAVPLLWGSDVPI